MNLKFKFLISLLFFPPLISSYSNNQSKNSKDDELNLIDKGKKIENSISFFTPESNFESLKGTNGEKIAVKIATLIINGDTLNPEEINTRGGSTLLFKRKSFSFILKSDASFRHGERTESFKKFFVLSLSMDRNYCNNRLAFEMMESIQHFDLFYYFFEMGINCHCE